MYIIAPDFEKAKPFRDYLMYSLDGPHVHVCGRVY